MTIKELKELIKNFDDNTNVNIVTATEHNTINKSYGINQVKNWGDNQVAVVIEEVCLSCGETDCNH